MPQYKEKTAKQIERHFKGAANHYRIVILGLVAKNPGITLEEIAEHLPCSMRTTSEHTRRLVQAGLLNKSYRGRWVAHSLSPYGRIFNGFIERFSKYAS